MTATRRDFLQKAATAAMLSPVLSSTAYAQPRAIRRGRFAANWESLVANYRVPEWFRDAKFGMWSHWSAQCVPEQGDWYARRMYLQGDPAYEYHVSTYGHPSRAGFMEVIKRWKADHWEADQLAALFKRAGARYLFSLANHHDNFDCYDSSYHAWNSVRIGPKKDIVGIWSKAAKKHGLRFGVSNHSSWAPRWYQPAYGYDGEGPLAGVRYDAARLTRAHGRGTWWQGLDPQALYTGPSVVMPDGINSAEAVREWHSKNTSLARSNPMPAASFVENWFVRCRDLVDKYRPDLLYFDTNELPLGQAGLDVVAHYYNMRGSRSGEADVVVNGKHIAKDHVGAFVEDIERGVARGIRPDVWQTDTCIGQWHYDRALAENGRYKSVGQVARMLVDIVSKNGNLLLSIPQRGDGSIDQHETAFLEGMARWITINGEGIYGSRPWKVFGEGPTFLNPPVVKKGEEKEKPIPYTPEDVRFTTKGSALYAYLLEVPRGASVTLTSLAAGSSLLESRSVSDVSMLGGGKLSWRQNEKGLTVQLPDRRPSEHTLALRIRGLT